MKKLTYKGENQRLDMYVSGLLDITRSQAQKKIKSGLIKIAGETSKSNKVIVRGDVIEILKADILITTKEPPKVDIVYEDENVIVADKAPGVVVYPSFGNESGTMVDAMREKIDIKDEERPGVVHRLDKDTSGLIVLAKNQKALEYLQEEIKNRKFDKTYLTLVWGKVEPEKGTIDIPIQRSDKDRKKMEASSDGRESLTDYEVLKYYDNMTFLKVKIITGRTHQIRVHFAGIGYPVVGDKTYGSRSLSFPPSSVIPAQVGIHPQLTRQFLHAHELDFELFGKKYKFKSELPKDLNEFLEQL